MDGAPESFPYRCLPLAIANAHGWEVLSPCGFEALWNGGLAPEDVTIRGDEGTRPHELPVALFGQGTFTIHVQGLLRTPPGWNLFVSGPPNSFKDGAAPLSGIIETDWSPYTFTMNWRLTRPEHPVRFEENEPIAHFFPVQRGAAEQMEPSFLPIDDEPELKAQFEQWSSSRNAFQEQVRSNPPTKPADKWQKLYYRGLTPGGDCPAADHQTKLQIREFARQELAGGAAEAMTKAAVSHAGSAIPDKAGRGDKGKYEWLMESLSRQRALSSEASGIFRCSGLSSQEFLDEFYAPGRPVVIEGAIEDWPALRLWNADYLKTKLGDRLVEYQGERETNIDFERSKNAHQRQIEFAHFLEMIAGKSGNQAYITAFNSTVNRAALAPLYEDVRPIPEFLLATGDSPEGMFWIGPKGTFTSLHHDLTNNLLVQVTGRKRVIMAEPLALPKMYNDKHVFSEIRNLADPSIDFRRFPQLRDVPVHEIVLAPGEMLYIPLAWWHQVEALDFSISMTFTNFRWRNDFYETYPCAG